MPAEVLPRCCMRHARANEDALSTSDSISKQEIPWVSVPTSLATFSRISFEDCITLSREHGGEHSQSACPCLGVCKTDCRFGVMPSHVANDAC